MLVCVTNQPCSRDLRRNKPGPASRSAVGLLALPLRSGVSFFVCLGGSSQGAGNGVPTGACGQDGGGRGSRCWQVLSECPGCAQDVGPGKVPGGGAQAADHLLQGALAPGALSEAFFPFHRGLPMRVQAAFRQSRGHGAILGQRGGGSVPGSRGPHGHCECARARVLAALLGSCLAGACLRGGPCLCLHPAGCLSAGGSVSVCRHRWPRRELMGPAGPDLVPESLFSSLAVPTRVLSQGPEIPPGGAGRPGQEVILADVPLSQVGERRCEWPGGTGMKGQL